MKQERRRLENERRLEGQRLEYKRKIEARRKAEEEAGRAQSEVEERSTNGGELPNQQRSGSKQRTRRVRQRRRQKQPLMEESVVKAECREDAKGGRSTVAIKVDDNQKVHHDDDDAEIVGAPGPRVLEHDTGATCLAIADEEHSESHLIMIAHVSHVSLSPLSADMMVTKISIINRISRHDRALFSQLQQCPMPRLRCRSHRVILLIRLLHTLAWGTSTTSKTT